MQSRREFLTKSVYVAPVILTLNAVPAFAGIASAQATKKRRRRRSRRYMKHESNPI